MTQAWIDAARGRLFAQRWTPLGARDAPIVLFHDSLGSVALWRAFPDVLARATGRDVIAYDRLGFGASDAHPGALGMDFVREEAGASFAALLEHFAVEEFVALGHSVGGAMATACAAHFPGRCRALITEAAQTFVEERTLTGIREARHAFAQPGQLERLAKYHGEKARWVLDAWIDTWLSAGFRHWTLDDDIRNVRCPLLALRGDRDEYGSPKHLERFESAGGVVVTALLPGCGHVPHREQPDTVIDSVKEFLVRHAA